jgi:alpha-L-fucosidase
MRATAAFFKKLLLTIIVSVATLPISAQNSYQPSPENLKARQEFQDAKFGMFIHRGVYSVLGDGEWVLHDRKLTLHEYERLPKFSIPRNLMRKPGSHWRSLRA